MKYRNPYQEINWNNIHRIQGTTHMHCPNAQYLQNIYDQGIRHMSVSNYYPSAPIYPLSSREDFAEVIREDMISCPNAEHHSMMLDGEETTFDPLHVTAPGSTWCSGRPLKELPKGVNASWRYGFRQLLEHLQFEDGGGIVINHPTWSKLPVELMTTLLDYDRERVLGIEIYNDSCEQLDNPPDGWDLENWDAILMTGRRCWGFAVPDHHSSPGYHCLFRGRNVLLVEEAAEHACLKAYRDGAFYCQLQNGELAFKKIAITDQNSLVIETDHAARIDVIADGALRASAEGNSLIFDLSNVKTYCRIEAHSEEDAIFSNPIMVL